MKRWFFIWMLILQGAIVGAAYGAIDIHPLAGTTGMTFLKIGVGARPVGMGEAFTGVADDVSALYWNPAGLGRLKEPELMLIHTEWFQGIRYEYIGYSHPTGNWGTLSGGVNMVYVTDIGETTSEGPTVKSRFGAYDLAANLGYSKGVLPGLYLGANAKFLYEMLGYGLAAPKRATIMGFAGDLSAFYNITETEWYQELYPEPRWLKEFIPDSVGFNAQNLGYLLPPTRGNGKVSEDGRDNLPMIFRLGTAHRFLDNALTYAMDVDVPLDNYPTAHFGLEYWIADTIAPRLGYKTSVFYNDFPWYHGFEGGLGFRWWRIQIDYGLVFYGDLGGTHRVSLIWRFGERGEVAIKKAEPVDEMAQELIQRLRQAEIHYQKGVVYQQQSNYDAAISEFKKTIELDPSHVQAHKQLGAVYIVKGMIDEAIEIWKKALELDPTDENLNNALKKLQAVK
ncbi:MAG: PorV/PorQ family protein [bacterium]